MAFSGVTIDGQGSGSGLFAHNWKLDQIEHEDGPTMSAAGTCVKFLVLLVLFSAGFLYSWHHFYSGHAFDDPITKTHIYYGELQAWQGAWPYVELRYPLYAWVLFLLFFVGIFITKKGLAITAPLSALVLGIGSGSFEYVLRDHYPYVTLICGLLVIGLFLGLFIAYWMDFVDPENFFSMYGAGVIGGVIFLYVATVVLRSFGINVPFAHQMPGASDLFFLSGLLLGCGTVVDTFHDIQKAIDAGAPKWVEWRAAVCLFSSFFILLKLARRVLLRRGTGVFIREFFSEIMSNAPRS